MVIVFLIGFHSNSFFPCDVRISICIFSPLVINIFELAPISSIVEKKYMAYAIVMIEPISSSVYMIIYLFRSNVNSGLKFFSQKSKKVLLLGSIRDIIDVSKKHKYFMR